MRLDGTVTDDVPRLRPLTADEFEAWLPRQVAGYAALIAASSAMPARAAREKAERDTARYFRRGFATPGQLLFRVLAGDLAVGWLWLGVPGPDPDPLMAWVFEGEIEAGLRARGHAARRAGGALPGDDVARAQRARAERRRPVAVRQPGVRGHDAADAQAAARTPRRAGRGGRPEIRIASPHRTGV